MEERSKSNVRRSTSTLRSAFLHTYCIRSNFDCASDTLTRRESESFYQGKGKGMKDGVRVWFGLYCFVVVLFGWDILAWVVVRIFRPNGYFYRSAEPVEKARRCEDTYHDTRQENPTKQYNKTTRQQQG